jgi:hypothetical protein
MTKKEILEHIEDRCVEGITADHWIGMIANYLSSNQLLDLLDVNGLSPRFFGEEDE